MERAAKDAHRPRHDGVGCPGLRVNVARRLAPSLAVAVALAATAAPARATEGETDVGAAVLASFLVARGKGTHLGGGAAVTARHGITDAFDLAAELSFALHPSIGSTRLGAAAGAHYVVDVARFRPHLGLLLGVEDLWTSSCDPRPSNLVDVATERPPLFDCGHELLPAAVAPIGIEYAPDAPWRLGLASRITVLPFRSEIPDTLLAIGIGASFSWRIGGSMESEGGSLAPSR